jgi:phosphoglucosamine mutase
MPRVFGTDGVRGLANREVTAELALDLSVAAARVILDRGDFDRTRERPLAVVGRDPRISGQILEHAVVAGLASAGVDVLRLRVVPTPGVAYLTDALDADLGVVISASHNPMPDNGIKFLARGGHKLDDAVEAQIEELLGSSWDAPIGAAVGRVRPYERPIEEYVDHLLTTLDRSLTGLKVVVDCANGAATEAAPMALRAAGADVVVIGAEPDGLNINDGCGSTYLGPLQAAVVEHGADVGIALDGDADRSLAVDHEGNDVDGDQLLAILALDLAEAGRLVDDTVVATVMSNLGFVQAMEAAGLRVRQTRVGDRYVLEEMRKSGCNIGGEQSGHIILTDHATTGDGLVAGLQVLAALVEAQAPASELLRQFEPLPQLLKNVRFNGGAEPLEADSVRKSIAAAEAELEGKGRLVIRKSGTEPLIRVMAEGDDPAMVERVVDDICEAVQSAA